MSELFNEQERKKPGPKPKPQVDVDALQKRVESLEAVIAIMAHQSGIPNSTLKLHNITPYVLQKKDMSKYA